MLNHIINLNPITWLGDKLFQHSKLFSSLSEHFRHLFLNNAPNNVEKLLFGIGLGAITCKIFHSIYQMYKFWSWVPQFMRNAKEFSQRNWKQKYGDCYVLITGAADGIGFAYSRYFAKLGFNLIMVDIQERKLQFKKNQLEETFLNIKVQAFVVDMSDEVKLQEFVNTILKMSNEIDIGIVINNVGLTGGGNYMEIDPNLMKKTLCVNFRPAYEINKALIPRLRTRKSRSAVINMSSATAVYFSHRVGVYSSIKNLVDIYSRTLSLENRDKIDIISVRPFGVKTAMLKMKKDPRIITPKQCAVAALTDLGNSETSFSGVQHKIMAAFFERLDWEGRLQIYDQNWKK